MLLLYFNQVRKKWGAGVEIRHIEGFPVAQVCRILQETGRLILSGRAKTGLAVKSKEGCGNFVTQWDMKAQKYIKDGLKKLFPEAVFFAEENDGEQRKTGSQTIYLDPIDGTGNYIRGCPEFSISAAFISGGVPVFGAVYLPCAGEMYYALQGQGAYRNGERIWVSGRKIEDALIIAGSASYYKDSSGDRSMRILKKLFLCASDFRRYGSAAMEMCYVACGRAEVFYELKLFPWDYAAGALIVKEAGGTVTDMWGEELSYEHAGSVLCSNREVYGETLKACCSVTKETAKGGIGE